MLFVKCLSPHGFRRVTPLLGQTRRYRQERRSFKTSNSKFTKSVSDQQAFWDTMHGISSRRAQPQNSISAEDWFIHFKSVLQNEVDNEEEDSLQYDENYFQNRPISREEVLIAIWKLTYRKAAGPGGIIGEMIKWEGDSVVDFLVKLFNVLFDDGIFLEDWPESIILPLFKKGTVNNPNNYRGISL